MKLIITGGHLSPALSVVSALPKNTEVVLVGRKYTLEGDTHLSFEYKTAQQLHISFLPITTGRLQRTFTKHSIPSLIKLPIGIYQALSIFSKYKPDVILSFGGYVGLPVVIAGAILRIPIIIHEQTLKAGLTNKIASRFALRICISWESSKKYFPQSKTVLTGNPLKKFTISDFKLPAIKEKLPILFGTGGSAGSHTINVLIEGCITKLLEQFIVIHQTGDNQEFQDFDRLKKLQEALPSNLKERYMVTKFIHPTKVGAVFLSADIVVSRSGMNTITELMHFGKPALLIPLNKEQETNALFLKNIGLAEVYNQDTLSSETLALHIIKLKKNLLSYKKNSVKAKALLIPNAAENIINVVNAVVKQ